MKKKLVAGLVTGLFALGLAGTVSALTTVGGYNFDDNAFADSLLSSSGSWTYGGALTLEAALVGSTSSDFAYCFGTECSVTMSFDDNLLYNGAGNDLAVFELGTVEQFNLELEVAGSSKTYSGIDTGFSSGGFSLIVALIDLDEFGIGFGDTISQLTLFPAPLGGDSADFTVIGALNNTAPVPEPATMLLFSSGIVYLAGTLLCRKKK